MIRRITSILNEAVLAMPVGRRIPFAEVADGVPSTHAGNGQFVPIINDAAGSVSYWRANGAQQVTQLDPTASCGDAVRVSVPIALVAFVRREQCDAPDELLNSAAHQVRASLKAVRTSIQGAFGASVSGLSLGVDVARTSEVKDFVVPSPIVVLTLSMVVHIDASSDCLERCGEPYDLACAVIGNASNAKVVACLGPERIAEICDGGGPCAPFTITVNGPGNVFTVINDPCGEAFNVPVSNTEGDLVGGLVDGAWQIGNATVLRDGVPYGEVKAEGSIDVTSDRPDVCEEIAGMNGNSVAACIADGERVDVFCALMLRDEITAEVIITCADGAGKIDGLLATYQRKDSDGVNIGTPGTINPGGSEDVTCPDGVVRDTADTVTVMNVKSNESKPLPQSVIKYKDASNASQVTAASDTEYASGALRPALEIQRRELKNLGGTGMGVYATAGALIADTIPNAPIPLKFGWGAGDADTLAWTVTTDEAGTYTAYTDDGGSGTVTYSKNGANFAALSGTVTLAVSDTIVVRRTTTTNAGWSRWAP